MHGKNKITIIEHNNLVQYNNSNTTGSNNNGNIEQQEYQPQADVGYEHQMQMHKYTIYQRLLFQLQ